jgi:hypothetical protein
LLLERLLRVSLAEVEARRARKAVPAQARVGRPWRMRVRRIVHAVTPRLPFAFTVLAAAATTAYFAYYTIQHHYRLQTSSWDLAIFDNMMWNLCRGEWFKASPDLGRTGSHIQYHATFVAYLLVPFYALRQQADTLLFLQALIVGAGAIPLFLLAKLKTQSGWVALVLAIAYCLHGPLHGPVFYDFHFLTLAPFFVWWVLYFFETGRRKLLIAAFVVTLLLREDVAACLSLASLFLLVSRQRPWWALGGGLLAAVYFIAMKFAIMPLHRGAADKETFTERAIPQQPPVGVERDDLRAAAERVDVARFRVGGRRGPAHAVRRHVALEQVEPVLPDDGARLGVERHHALLARHAAPDRVLDVEPVAHHDRRGSPPERHAPEKVLSVECPGLRQARLPRRAVAVGAPHFRPVAERDAPRALGRQRQAEPQNDDRDEVRLLEHDCVLLAYSGCRESAPIVPASAPRIDPWRARADQNVTPPLTPNVRGRPISPMNPEGAKLP